MKLSNKVKAMILEKQVNYSLQKKEEEEKEREQMLCRVIVSNESKISNKFSPATLLISLFFTFIILFAYHFFVHGKTFSRTE